MQPRRKNKNNTNNCENQVTAHQEEASRRRLVPSRKMIGQLEDPENNKLAYKHQEKEGMP